MHPTITLIGSDAIPVASGAKITANHFSLTGTLCWTLGTTTPPMVWPQLQSQRDLLTWCTSGFRGNACCIALHGD